MDYTLSYIKMLVVLAIIIAFLLFMKKIVEKKNITGLISNDIQIKSTKMIDTKNRISVISYKDKEYLVLLGDNNLLLDSFDSFDKDLKEVIEKTNNS